MPARNYAHLDDQALITAVLQGDQDAAVYLLVEKCGSSLKYLVSFKFRSLQIDFEDLVSELFIALSEHDWKALREFVGHNQAGQPCRLENYISVIAARRLCKKMERAVKESGWLSPLDGEEGFLVPDDAAEREQRTSELLQAIMALKNPVERLVLIAYKLEDLSVHEVAAMLEIEPGHVYTHCSRALAKLRTLLAAGSDHA